MAVQVTGHSSVPVQMEIRSMDLRWRANLTAFPWCITVGSQEHVMWIGLANLNKPQSIDFQIDKIDMARRLLLGLQVAIQEDDKRYGAGVAQSELLAEQAGLRRILESVTAFQCAPCEGRIYCTAHDTRGSGADRQRLARLEIPCPLDTPEFQSAAVGLTVRTRSERNISWIELGAALPERYDLITMFLDAAHARALRDSMLACMR